MIDEHAQALPEHHLPEGARKAHLEKITKIVSHVEAPPTEGRPAERTTPQAQGHTAHTSAPMTTGAGR